jgi:pimeloyl-ACP methyl ester carboxylesterase
VFAVGVDCSTVEGTAMTTAGSSTPPTDTTITEHELQQCEQVNATGRLPVVFIHGLWLLPSSWDRWAALFEDNGYVALMPGWPDDPDTVEEAKAHPEVFAGKSIGQVADHFEEIIRGLARKPAIIGHSFGGLLTQILAGRGLAAASVAIDPAPFRGVLPLPISSLKSAFPVLGNPANRSRAVPLTYEQFRYGFANAVSEDAAKQLYETYAVPTSGKPLFQAAAANLNRVDRGQGRHRQPTARPTADHLRREGPHRALSDCARLRQAAGGQRRRHRDRRDQEPRHALTIDSGLARGRRHRPRLRQALHVGRPDQRAGHG